MMLTYDAVVVTRNRPQALALSIPLLAAQSRPPNQLIVVDSSDDPGGTEAVVRACASEAERPIKLVRSKPGASLQRNVGLTHVDADVTFFPDDDSLVFRDALDWIMRIYERDTANVVGGVCAADEASPPSKIASENREYQMTRGDIVRQFTATARYEAEDRFIPDPFKTFARQRDSQRSLPPWLAEENAVIVEWMTGYRMSFRTDSVRRIGFDEALGRYSLFEDVDASFGVGAEQLLVGARNAKVHHYKSPGARDAARAMGVMQILNRAYVLAKHNALAEPVVRDLYRFSRYKIAQYAVGASSRSGRARLKGAVDAYRNLPLLLRNSHDVTNGYIDLRKTLLSGG